MPIPPDTSGEQYTPTARPHDRPEPPETMMTTRTRKTRKTTTFHIDVVVVVVVVVVAVIAVVVVSLDDTLCQAFPHISSTHEPMMEGMCH